MQNLVINREEGVYQFTEGGTPFCYPSVTAVLQLLRRLAGEWDADDAELRRGQFVHKCCALLDGGLDGSGLAYDTVDPSLRGYLQAWEKFIADTGFRSSLIETPVRSHLYRYAGTPDRVGVLRGKHRVLLDLKTGTSVSVTEGPQLGAYWMAGKETLKDSGADPVFRGVTRYAVHLHDDGSFKMREYTDQAGDFSVFVSCLMLWNCLHRKGKIHGNM